MRGGRWNESPARPEKDVVRKADLDYKVRVYSDDDHLRIRGSCFLRTGNLQRINLLTFAHICSNLLIFAQLYEHCSYLLISAHICSYLLIFMSIAHICSYLLIFAQHEPAGSKFAQ